MSQFQTFQDVARYLLAAGGANALDGEGTYLLYTDRSTVDCKLWTGKAFGRQMLAAPSVRQNSTAAHVLTPNINIIVYISASSTVQAVEYDEDGDEWDNYEAIPSYKVHHNSKLAAAVDASGRICVVFQDPSKNLICFDTSTGHTTISVKPSEGTPISIAVVKDRVFVFYVSEKDNCVHYAQKDGWKDKVLSRRLKGNVKQFMVTPNLQVRHPEFEVYVLTEENAMLQIMTDGSLQTLGRLDETGMFVSERSVDLCCIDAWEHTLTADRLKRYFADDSSFLDDVGGPKSATPLATACWSGNLDAVRLLLDNPYRLADPNALSPGNLTPLYFAICRSQKHRKEMVSALLDAGANVDECYSDSNFNTPLMIAVADTPDKDVIHELVDRSASLTVKNGRGQTALMLAKGSGMELELRRRSEREAEMDTSVKELVDILVALVMFVVGYIKSDVLRDIVNRIVTKLNA